MTCPFCGHIEDRVIDSRESREGDSIRRRRQCLGCEKRFTTYERIDEVPYMVIKKDGRREKFDRQKVLNGLLKACEKRPVSMAKLSDLVNLVEGRVTDSPDREITTTEIGEYLMDSLRGVDKIAYVRFASVYRDFQDEQAFLNELRSLTRQFPGGPGERGGRGGLGGRGRHQQSHHLLWLLAPAAVQATSRLQDKSNSQAIGKSPKQRKQPK